MKTTDLKATNGSYIYDVRTEGGRGDPEICHVLWILLLLRSNRSVVHFRGCRG